MYGESERVSTSLPYYNLGTYQRAINSPSEEAQVWCTRGLIWSYAFNHEESEKCFKRALAFDGDCAFAHWGVAYALGPNYNLPWDSMDKIEDTVRRGRRAIEEAKAVVHSALPVERAIVEALEHRFPAKNFDEDKAICNQQYADAMEKVYEEHPDDLDVAVLYADALMNLTPWRLWDLPSGKPASDARTLDAKAVLDRAMAQHGGMQHPGLLHLYIHLMEMSPTPEAALDAANRLRDIVPDSGHLNHMPSHIDVLIGDYQNGIDWNQEAIVADEKFLAREGALKFYTLYRMHDYHFRIYCAMFAGQSKPALESATRILEAVPESLLRLESPPMADWIESFISMRVHVLIRFGRWQDLIGLPLPEDAVLYCVTIAMTHYGKGMAYAATGKISEAEKEREAFQESSKLVPTSRTLFNNTCVDILRVAEAMLDGELEYRKGLHETAFAHLREAMNRSRNLPYDEPWGFMQPPCHALGALLMEQGHFGQAITLYEDDLGVSDSLPRALRHPKNVWALHGYHECLLRLGRTEEAEVIKPQLDLAVAGADTPVRSSCFCRTYSFVGAVPFLSLYASTTVVMASLFRRFFSPRDAGQAYESLPLTNDGVPATEEFKAQASPLSPGFRWLDTARPSVRWFWALVPFCIARPLRKTDRTLPKTTSTTYLNGIRGLACWIVLNHHMTMDYYRSWIFKAYGAEDPDENQYFFQLPIVRVVHTGKGMVCLFFALSGFVLGYSSLRKINSHHPEKVADDLLTGLCSALLRRGIRLFTPMFVLAFITSILTYYMPWGDMDHDAPSLMAQLHKFYLSCVAVMNPYGWESHKMPMHFPHAWTLALEYRLSLALFLVLIATCRLATIPRKLVISSVAIWSVYCDRRWDVMGFMGGLLVAELRFAPLSNDFARLIRRPDFKPNRWLGFVAGFVAVVLGLLFCSWPENAESMKIQPYHFFWKLAPKSWQGTTETELSTAFTWYFGSIGSIIFLWGLERLPLLQRVLSCAPLRYLGEISYAFYLVHWIVRQYVGYPLFRHLTKAQEWPKTPSFVVAYVPTLVLTVLLGDYFWRAVDEKCVKLARFLVTDILGVGGKPKSDKRPEMVISAPPQQPVERSPAVRMEEMQAEEAVPVLRLD
ncbi:hypothetical protein DL762_006848 [Monosporascus cannonballus]|uniref:Acyltransferase 3 domain-containing protein n=1 Tax=Monosporascus cannonballus TaxID=155416 RepID=A0ABY0H1W9_9PEZI|nr:hypothetical protein DL762_006848 [Monosporascus cannonballus]